jgi:acyl-coenzyme A synthetase/AMP-(fatty) acid ligase/acyl carrier protein
LKEEKITFFHAPSDLFRQFLDLLTENDFFPKLRQITPSGRLYKKDVERIRKHIPVDCLLIQRLASTETGMITRFKIDQNTKLSSNVIPVGYAVEDKEVLILNEAGEPLDFNCVGEIVVKSRYLASGYWRRPDLTQKAFLADQDGSDRKMYRLGDLGRMRPDGCLELIGRKDFQVKIRGYRVELGEIEAALLDLDIIKEAIVITQELDTGEKRIVAYFVPAGQVKITASHLRRALSEKLPEYMVPSIFVPLKKLPLTDRNKIDRNALPDPGRSRPDLDELYAAPQTPAEKMLAKIWSDVLNIEPVGIHDNFFELGGDSLLATQIIVSTNFNFQIEIPLRSIYDTQPFQDLP